MRLRRPVDPSRDHVLGPRNAELSLVEYGDFECPFCARAFGEVRTVVERLRGDLQFVFRNFPLPELHAHALLAAEAAEAAGTQDRFWEMHALLYENQPHMRRSNLVGYAHALDLDVRAFENDLDTHVHLPRIRDDVTDGVRSGVRGTPTFFVNGVLHEGRSDASSLLVALENAVQGGREMHAP